MIMAVRKRTTKKKPALSAQAGKKASSQKSSWNWNQAVEYYKKNPVRAGLVTFGILVLYLLIFPLRFLVVPAAVNGDPIYSWQYISKMHQSSGQQVLNQLISEKLVEQEIAKTDLIVTEAEVQAQVDQITSQFGEAAGLDEVLALQGLEREEFMRQLRLNLALEKVVKSTIEVSEEDVTTELAENAATYIDLAEPDAATTAAENIRNSRLQETFQVWFEEVRQNASITNLFAPEPEALPGLGL